MAFFCSFTDSLRQKWLNFYQTNRNWITLHMEVESVYTPDGGKRPSSYLILGVANALEPKLTQLMLPFSKLNADADTLVEVLDLHFDPEMVLGNRVIPPVETQEVDDDDSAVTVAESEFEEKFEEKIEEKFEEKFEEKSEEKVEDEFDREIMVAKEFISSNEFKETSVDDLPQTEEAIGVGESDAYAYEDTHQAQSFASAQSLEDFGDISFDAENPLQGNLDEGSLENFDADDDSNQFSNVLMDVWGEESSVPDGEAHSEEDESENAFDDTEIARLFPDT